MFNSTTSINNPILHIIYIYTEHNRPSISYDTEATFEEAARHASTSRQSAPVLFLGDMNAHLGKLCDADTEDPPRTDCDPHAKHNNTGIYVRNTAFEADLYTIFGRTADRLPTYFQTNTPSSCIDHAFISHPQACIQASTIMPCAYDGHEVLVTDTDHAMLHTRIHIHPTEVPPQLQSNQHHFLKKKDSENISQHLPINIAALKDPELRAKYAHAITEALDSDATKLHDRLQPSPTNIQKLKNSPQLLDIILTDLTSLIINAADLTLGRIKPRPPGKQRRRWDQHSEHLWHYTTILKQNRHKSPALKLLYFQAKLALKKYIKSNERRTALSHFNKQTVLRKTNAKLYWANLQQRDLSSTIKSPRLLKIPNTNSLTSDEQEISSIILDHHFPSTPPSSPLHAPVNDSGNRNAIIEANISQSNTTIEFKDESKPSRHELLNANISTRELDAALDRLQNGKAADHNLIRAELLKVTHNDKHPLGPILLLLFNILWLTDLTTPDLIHSRVVLIDKKAKVKTTPKAWRPIAISSCIGKLFETIIGIRLTGIVESENQPSLHTGLSDYQHGFRPFLGTVDLLTVASETIKYRARRGHYTWAVSLDIANAFGSISHTKIIESLHQQNISGHLFNAIYATLPATAHIHSENPAIRNNKSAPATCGVRQGSIKGYVETTADVVVAYAPEQG